LEDGKNFEEWIERSGQKRKIVLYLPSPTSWNSKFEFSNKKKATQRILRIDARSDQFRKMSLVAAKQKN